MKYQLATVNRAWDSTMDKNLSLVYGRIDVRTARTLYAPSGPRPRGHTNQEWSIAACRQFLRPEYVKDIFDHMRKPKQ